MTNCKRNYQVKRGKTVVYETTLYQSAMIQAKKLRGEVFLNGERYAPVLEVRAKSERRAQFERKSLAMDASLSECLNVLMENECNITKTAKHFNVYPETFRRYICKQWRLRK